MNTAKRKNLNFSDGTPVDAELANKSNLKKLYKKGWDDYAGDILDLGGGSDTFKFNSFTSGAPVEMWMDMGDTTSGSAYDDFDGTVPSGLTKDNDTVVLSGDLEDYAFDIKERDGETWLSVTRGNQTINFLDIEKIKVSGNTIKLPNNFDGDAEQYLYDQLSLLQNPRGPEPVSADLIAEVSVTGWSGSFYHSASAAGGGEISNSWSQVDGPAPYFGETSATQGMFVTAGAGTAQSDVAAGTAHAALEFNTSGQAQGFKVEGLTSAGFGGMTADSGSFTVSFTIEGNVGSTGASGLFGVWVDAYSVDAFGNNLGDLDHKGAGPTAQSDFLETDSFVYMPKEPGSTDYAWFFDYSTYDQVVDEDGDFIDNVIGSFEFGSRTDFAAGIYDVVEVTAFALGQATVSDSGLM